jgi:aconitate hydratase
MSFEKLNIKGDEKISINFSEIKQPLQKIICKIEYSDGRIEDVNLIANILNDSEIETLQYGGIMQKVLVKIYS